MFSLLTHKKTTEDAANNAQVIELGKASKLTLGGEGYYPENIRANRWAFLDENSN